MKLRLQVLISTMYQKDYSLLDRMNIQTDAVVINQCDTDTLEIIERNGHQIKWICTTERGIGRSRNRAILASDADILLFADDDVVYSDGYENVVISAFENHIKYSLIVFNVKSTNPKRPAYINQHDKRLNKFNSLRYGAFRMAVKRKVILSNNIWFSLLFGGGAPYQAGEDNLFITDCIHKKINCIASKSLIGIVRQEESTWFKGYDDKYYFDRGVLFGAMYKMRARGYLMLIDLKESFYHKKSEKPLFERHKLGIDGLKEYIKEMK